MNIIICSKLFSPSNSIGAVRTYNVAKYLHKFGNSVTVICESSIIDRTLEMDGIQVYGVQHSNYIKQLLPKVLNRASATHHNELEGDISFSKAGNIREPHYSKISQFYFTTRRQLFKLIVEIDWYYKAKKIVQRDLGESNFDFVISSYGPYGSYLLGQCIAKSKMAKYWISDLRDIMHNEENPFWLNLLYRHHEKYMIEKANAVTVVSEGQARMLKEILSNNNYKNNKIHVISNGYEKRIEALKNTNQDKILRITYTGELYSGRRDFRLLFDALNDLLKERYIDSNKIIFNYAGGSVDYLKLQLDAFPYVQEICKNWGFVDRETALDIQRQSSILVVLTWNTVKDQGVLTGKFQEYLQFYKPIIAITQGDLANGELSQLIREMKLGIACEYVDYDKSLVDLKEFILSQYKHVQEGKPLIFEPNLCALKDFHYEKIVGKFHSLCERIVAFDVD